jgi:hypothetical protein
MMDFWNFTLPTTAAALLALALWAKFNEQPLRIKERAPKVTQSLSEFIEGDFPYSVISLRLTLEFETRDLEFSTSSCTKQ